MAKVSAIKRGLIINFKNSLYEITDFLHVKPGKGNTFVRTDLKDVLSGKTIQESFRLSDTIDIVRLESEKFQYLYKDGEYFTFMNTENYEQISLFKNIIGDNEPYLVNNIEVDILFSPERKVLKIELPITIEMKLKQCDPSVKGNTISGGGGKNAVTETGLTLKVPFFIKIDDILKVDTRTGEYIERVKS